MSTRHVATFGVRADSGTDSSISRPRDRDIPPEDQYGKGRGQSYRPGLVRDRTPPPRIDSYRARSPPRRPDYIDSYKSDSYRVPIRGRSRTPPPRRDDYRRRSPTPPRFRDRELRGGDSYRVRPRSPPPRREDLPRDDLFRREPARDDRDFRDSRDFRDERDRGYASGPRSPPRFRDRSPMPLKRVRDPSPISSRGRRTPPLKRERLASPPRGRYDDYPPSRGVSPPRRRFTPDVRDRRPSPPRGVRDYRPRSRTPPPRNDRVEPRPGDDWRRPRSTIREPRSDHPSREQSAHASTATSRRSSPPVHPARSNLPQQPPLENRVSSTRPSPRTPYENREQQQELPRAPAPEPNRAPAPHHDTNKDVERPIPSKPEPAPAAREPPRSEDAPAVPRAPPTGPGGYRGPPATSAPPTGPAATTRAPGGAPPSGPRGAPASRGDFAPRGRGGAGPDFTPRGRGGFGTPFRGGRGGAPPSGPSFTRSESFGQDSATSSPSFPAARGPPSGPRASIAQAPTAPAFRQSSMSSNSTTTTYPRSQRFAPNGDPLPDHHHHHSPHPQPPTGPKAIRRLTEPMIPSLAPNNTGGGNHISHNGGYRPAHPQQHPALADISKLVEGGVRTETPLVDRSKLHKLEAEAEKLRRQVEEREARLRKSLREWDRLTREAETAALRTELAEEALKQLSGEPESQAAF